MVQGSAEGKVSTANQEAIMECSLSIMGMGKDSHVTVDETGSGVVDLPS